MVSTSPQPLDPQTLPSHDNLPDNPYAYCVELTGPLFVQTGTMIAYYPVGGGTIRFEPLTATSMTSMVASHFSSPLYSRDWVVANGRGHVILGDRGYDINSYDLADGNLTVRAANLLAFDAGLELKESIIPGFLTLLGTGKFLASSSGPVIFVEPPVRVDPEALVGWADCPAPSQHFDAGWMGHFLGAARGALFGTRSGEERQYDFTGAGTVLLQSSERMLEDPQLVRRLEGEVRQLAPNQLQHLAGVIQAQLQQQR
jgi:hypothetical protein